MQTDAGNGDDRGGGEDVLAPREEHREAIEDHLGGRNDRLGAAARVLLALVDGEEPEPEDVERVRGGEP